GVAGSVFPDFRTPRGARNPSGKRKVGYQAKQLGERRPNRQVCNGFTFYIVSSIKPITQKIPIDNSK
ncbi:hypothetical protein, partial [Acetobacter tropicalis]|uniref:hypothetical protein n=1 Tax=Acetobacter tropicalis TaxID=104102 RepID=UPI001C3CBA1D